ncbi:hypothetical protein D9M71_251670 [compost metagenome]
MTWITAADVDSLYQLTDVINGHPLHDQLVFTVRDVCHHPSCGGIQAADRQLRQSQLLVAGLLAEAQPVTVTDKALDSEDKVIRKVIGVYRVVMQHLLAQARRRIGVQVRQTVLNALGWGALLQ